jgi:GNAT superfamily N-acetyltransferase
MMPSIHVRPFRRGDREQLTRLVNAHAAAVVPGMSASVNAVLSQLEREPGEPITDPWVSERTTLIAEQRNQVVAAAHLLRYFADERAGDSYRDAGEIRWFLFWPEAPTGNPWWSDGAEAAEALMTACTDQFAKWGVTTQYADGDLPVRGVYGVPLQWPHVGALYERFAFAHTGQTEIVYLADVTRLRGPVPAPLSGLTLRRSVGINGTRLSGVLRDDVAGYIEVEIFTEGERLPRYGGWADIGNLHVAEQYRRRGVATWLLGHAVDWLAVAGVERLLDYACLDDDSAGYRSFLSAAGFRELTRTRRGWTRAAG